MNCLWLNTDVVCLADVADLDAAPVLSLGLSIEMELMACFNVRIDK